MHMYDDTTVVIPTLNEAKNIGVLLKVLEKRYDEISVIVADDGSKDGTQEVVRKFSKANKHIFLLDRSGKPKGLTASVLDGVMHAKTKFLVVMDADLQHPPEVIKAIVHELKNGAPVAVGTRIEKPDDWGFFRFLASDSAVWLGRLRLRLGGAYARDVVSGFFGVNAKLFKNQIESHARRFVPEGYKVCLDLLKTLPRKTHVAEVPYSFELRKEGVSKMGTRQIVAYIKSLLT